MELNASEIRKIRQHYTTKMPKKKMEGNYTSELLSNPVSTHTNTWREFCFQQRNFYNTSLFHRCFSDKNDWILCTFLKKLIMASRNPMFLFQR